MRMNWAVLAVILCYAAAPAATCDPRDQLSPLSEPEWTLAETGRTTTSRVLVAPNSMTEQAMQLRDATVVLTARRNLPSTSTAPQTELQSRLLMVCLGFVLAVAGGVMLLLPRR